MPRIPNLPRSLAFGILAGALFVLASCTGSGYASRENGAHPSHAVLDVAPELLRFDIMTGSIANYFYRRGPIAAHLLTTSGLAPRLLVAFPAGNTGLVLDFAPL